MKGEIPECKRCCCCLPLRYGLLAWGYLKMAADALMIAFSFYSLILTIMSNRLYGSDDDLLYRMINVELIISFLVLAVFLFDLAVTIVFIVGGHKKNVKLIRVFFFISIAMWIFSFLLSVAYVILIIQNGILSHHHLMNDYWKRFVTGFSFYFLVLVVQTYFLFLLRSEINKLQNIGKFRFVNNATEAESTMKCEEIVTGEETGREVY